MVVVFDATQVAFLPPEVSGTHGPAARMRQRMYPVTTAASLYLKCLAEVSSNDMLLSVRIISLCFYLSLPAPPAPSASVLPACPSRCEDRLALCVEAFSVPPSGLPPVLSLFSLSLLRLVFQQSAGLASPVTWAEAVQPHACSHLAFHKGHPCHSVELETYLDLGLGR